MSRCVRFAFVGLLGLWASGAAAGCTASERSADDDAGQGAQNDGGATSGNPPRGGSAGAGESSGRAGASAAGNASTMAGSASAMAGASGREGTSGTAGVPSQAGAPSAGGTSSAAGAPSAGGTSSAAGAPSAGGTSSTAGASSAGGTSSAAGQSGSGDTAGSDAGGSSGSGGQSGTGGMGGTGSEVPGCTTTLEGLDTACTLEQICDSVGCGTLSAELDQCGNRRVACDANADCRSDELCTPLVAWHAGIGCGVAQVDEEDCSVAVYQCARMGAFCTVAEGLPEPCMSDSGDIEFGHMVHMLVGRVLSTIAPEVRLPLLLCIERYNTAHPAVNYGDICYGHTDCDEACRNECERWYIADPEAAYDVLLSVLLEDDLELTMTPIARAMALLPQ